MGGLHDQIDVEPGGGEGLKQASRHARSVGHVREGQHGLVLFQFGPIHRPAQFQARVTGAAAAAIAGEQGAGGVAPAGAHHQGHAVVAGDLNGPGVQHGGPQAGQFQHLVAADRGHQLGIGHLAGVGGEHPGHIGVDLARFGPQGRGQGHGRGVGATPAQGGDLRGAGVAAAGALEARHHHHQAVVEVALQPFGAHLKDAGSAVGRFGDDAHLGPGHRDRRHPLGMERHGQQGDRHLLARGQQHVHLPLGRVATDRPCQAREFVGGVAHGRDHDHQVMAGLAAGGDAPGYGLDPFPIRDRGASELLNQQAHSRCCYA